MKLEHDLTLPLRDESQQRPPSSRYTYVDEPTPESLDDFAYIFCWDHFETLEGYKDHLKAKQDVQHDNLLEKMLFFFLLIIN